MNTKKDLVGLANYVHRIAFESYRELGPGFKEDTFQKALAISFRHSQVEYLKETNIEVFFKGESLGVFRLDFVILPQKTADWRLSDPVVIETKVASSIKNDARLQLKNYLLSLDSRILTIENGNDIFIKKAKFNAITVQLDGTFFFNTLREKLFWGHDSRNIQ